MASADTEIKLEKIEEEQEQTNSDDHDQQIDQENYSSDSAPSILVESTTSTKSIIELSSFSESSDTTINDRPSTPSKQFEITEFNLLTKRLTERKKIVLTVIISIVFAYFSLSLGYNLFTKIFLNGNSPRIIKYPSLNTCFNYAQCSQTEKLKVHVVSSRYISPDYSWLLQENADLIEIVQNPDDACLVLLFLHKYSSRGLLSEYYNKFSLTQNLLIIDTSHGNYSTYDLIFNYFNQTFNDDSTDVLHFEQFHNKLKCSLIASFTKNLEQTNERERNKNLNIHFSVIGLKKFKINHEKLDKNFYFLSSPRYYLFSYHQSDLMDLSAYDRGRIELIVNIFKNYTFNLNHAIEIGCSRDEGHDRQLSLCYNKRKRGNVLLNSTFTLVLLTNNTFTIETTIRLIECLRTASIPVFINQDVKLPLNEFIAWDEIIIRVPNRMLNQIDEFLLDITMADVIQRRTKGFNVYKTYFAGSRIQFRTLISAVRQRLNLPMMNYQAYDGMSDMLSELKIHNEYDSMEDVVEYDDIRINTAVASHASYASKQLKRTYTYWNELYFPFKLFPSIPNEPVIPTDVKYAVSLEEYDRLYANQSYHDEYVHGGAYRFYLFSKTLAGNDENENEQFTIVIYSYKREQSLIYNLKKYLKLRFLNRIIIVWDSHDVKPSNVFLNTFRSHLQRQFIYLISNKNDGTSLNNRFLPYNIIQTDAVLNMDDNTRLSNEAIYLGFRIWRESRNQLIGYTPRAHSWHVKSKQYIQRVHFKCEYSMVLTTAVFYHRIYNFLYTHVLDERIRNTVNEFTNCEDIAFNYMIAAYTRKAPIKVTYKTFERCKKCESFNETRPITTTNDFYLTRNKCINYFNQIFGYNPLLYSQYRADSVTYQGGWKHGFCFKYV